MRAVSVVPELHVASIAEAATLWRALGFELAFAFGENEIVEDDDASLEGTRFARFDAAGEAPVSVFLSVHPDSDRSVVHVMLDAPVQVDAAASRLRQAGVALIREPSDQPWGIRDLMAADPDGNSVVVGAVLEQG